jgi:SAM-dependent methyltransferase
MVDSITLASLLACYSATVTDDQIPKRYQKSLAKHGVSPRALKWTSYHSAALHYCEFVRELDLKGRSILDAGCGMGDLLPYIYAEADTFEYLGIDITPEFVATARKRYAPHKFQVGDVFDGSIKSGSFDVVLASGLMNHNTPGWMTKRQHMIKQLFEVAREVLVFNMAGSFGPKPAKQPTNVAYADALEIVKFCASLTPQLIFKSHYHPKDFTITMFK